MKIALVGYGKMGKEIEKIALERGHKIVAKFHKENPLDTSQLIDVDVAIDFSTPSAVLSNMHRLIEQQVPSVIGTTGWNDHLREVIEKTKHFNTSLVYASNFSVGVNLFFQLNKQLAKLMSAHENYQVELEEIHHTEKLDAPSGTAITLAEGIIENDSSKKHWYCPQKNAHDGSDSSIKINAFREADVKGTHRVSYNSPIDTIRIEHEAHNRKGFALGAVIASEWIINKKGVFTMQDVLSTIH